MALELDNREDIVQVEIWKMDFKEYCKCLEARRHNMSRVYAPILGQCSPTIRDHLEALEEWDVINNTSNAISLLTLIQKPLYQ